MILPGRRRHHLVVRLDNDQRAEDDGAVIDTAIMQREPIERDVHQRLVALRTAEREMRQSCTVARLARWS